MTAMTRNDAPVPALSAETVGVVAGLLAVLMWASYLAYARSGVNAGLLPQDFVVLRFGSAGLFMLPWLLFHKPSTLAGVGWGRGAALALFAGPVFILLGVGGYLFAPLSHGAVIQPSTIALGGMVAAAVVFREAITRRKLVGAALIVGGLMTIAGPGFAVGEGSRLLIGDLLFVAAGVSWVGFTLLLKRWSVGALEATAAVSVISAMVVVPAFILMGDGSRIAALPVSVLLAQIVVQGAFSGVLAVIAFGVSVKRLGASRAALFPAMVPAAALIVGIPITGEVPTVIELVGGGFATLGLMIAISTARLPFRRQP